MVISEMLDVNHSTLSSAVVYYLRGQRKDTVTRMQALSAEIEKRLLAGERRIDTARQLGLCESAVSKHYASLGYDRERLSALRMRLQEDGLLAPSKKLKRRWAEEAREVRRQAAEQRAFDEIRARREKRKAALEAREAADLAEARAKREKRSIEPGLTYLAQNVHRFGVTLDELRGKTFNDWLAEARVHLVVELAETFPDRPVTWIARVMNRHPQSVSRALHKAGHYRAPRTIDLPLAA
ncbi:hypothetical protein PUR29_34650 [Methylobacterium ajmalii]|uniref:Uncharacterized protein n=1 Tax=Methylobacterium ajmalii TaxID=2738439 RepID=A0ABV0A418_9HYPH